ncbi:MAG TPA: hypothetical protein VJR25_14355 [Microbacterium sp.]|uniref:hypothetical protein n=1 Tax=Microbacterium sp. TaxID=51671 RepID=UPI002B482A7A|nr:hypothetical protein [Microbacterium sp.]HKT57943.1 hypothetical protein [Microbacterium sp.]
MTHAAPPVVKLSTTAEAVAFLPALAGLPAQNCLLIAPFGGKHASRAMRILVEAEPTDASARRHASAALGALSKVPRCDSVVVAVYRDEPFSEIGPAWHVALGVILERLHSSGFDIKDAAIVAGDGWMPFFEGDPDAPQPLDEIQAATRKVPDDAAVDSTLYRLPDSDPELAAVVTELMLDRIVDGGEADSFGRIARTDPPNPIDVLERALAADPEDANAQTLARLLAQIDSEGAVDRTVLQIAFGAETGALSWNRTLMLRIEAAEAGCAPVDLMIQRGEDRQSKRLADLLTGRTREVPSSGRLEAGAVLLSRAVVHCSVPDRAWTMCALAWVRWALGLTTSAFEMLDAAQRVDPGNSHVPVLRTVFHHLAPQWLYQEPSPNRSERRRRTKGRE